MLLNQVYFSLVNFSSVRFRSREDRSLFCQRCSSIGFFRCSCRNRNRRKDRSCNDAFSTTFKRTSVSSLPHSGILDDPKETNVFLESSRIITENLQEQCIPLQSLSVGGSREEDTTPIDDMLSETHSTITDYDNLRRPDAWYLYKRLVDFINKKRKKRHKLVEHHTKVLYDTKVSHDYKMTKGKFAEALKKASKHGSLEETGRLLSQKQESGYSSPSVSAQPTPTASHRLIQNPIYMRRSLEMNPPKMQPKPRMSLPADHIRKSMDGRFSIQAMERRRRFSRGKTIIIDDSISPPAPITTAEAFGYNTQSTAGSSHHSKVQTLGMSSSTVLVTSRRMSRPGSSSREESTGEESGFEEEEHIEVRVPPLVLEERRESNTSSGQLKDPFEIFSEWIIPTEELKLGHILGKGAHKNIYRGKWHGDCMVHIFDTADEAAKEKYWNSVSLLSKIRHENLLLFMGVAEVFHKLAIVTQFRRGMSLYEHFIVGGKLAYAYKVTIARQMAQAMSYLHSLEIYHGRLTPRNIFLDKKIKLSLLEHNVCDLSNQPFDGAKISRGILQYYSPEIMRSLRIKDSQLDIGMKHTRYSDIYMFGCLLYEMFADALPFSGYSVHSIIFQIGIGRTMSLQSMDFAEAIKKLITRCWDATPTNRPNFTKDILTSIQSHENLVSINKCHSMSEPERLNKIGCPETPLKT